MTIIYMKFIKFLVDFGIVAHLHEVTFPLTVRQVDKWITPLYAATFPSIR